MREHAPGLPILVKGILTAEDATLAVEHQATRSWCRTMAVGSWIPPGGAGRALRGGRRGRRAHPVLVDGGVRRGTDVLKAIALGAAAVLVGRPVVWGLAADGEAGVASVLEILRAEFENAMALAASHGHGDRPGARRAGPLTVPRWTTAPTV